MRVGISFSWGQVGWLFIRGFFVMERCRVKAIFLLFSKASIAVQLLQFLRVPRHIFRDY